MLLVHFRHALNIPIRFMYFNSKPNNQVSIMTQQVSLVCERKTKRKYLSSLFDDRESQLYVYNSITQTNTKILRKFDRNNFLSPPSPSQQILPRFSAGYRTKNASIQKILATLRGNAFLSRESRLKYSSTLSACNRICSE